MYLFDLIKTEFVINIITGKYWVDPNAGDIRDAILVHCEMATRSTCIISMPTQTEELSYDGNENEAWVSEIKGGMKV